MGIGVSVFLLAVGAILAFAVDVTVQGLDLDTVGVILMIVGAIGLLLSALFLSSFSPYGRGTDRETVVREERL
jgi:DMSO/TMAO reductase YedYZ heme-binding membrane subunit